MSATSTKRKVTPAVGGPPPLERRSSSGNDRRTALPTLSSLDDEHPLLTARHIDDLKQSVRALNATIARTEDQRARDHRENASLLREIISLLRKDK